MQTPIQFQSQQAQEQAMNLGQTSEAVTASPGRQWYIQVEQQSYGPFDDQTLWAFMCEGRVNAQSLISQYPNTAYRPVSANPGLMNWIAQVPLNTAQNEQMQNPQVQNVQPQVQHAAAAQQSPQTAFMIMAEIRSGRGMEFLQTLQNLGDVERIGDTVWLLQASASSEDIRNVLCQPLDGDDRLFVMDSFANETAWFNLGAQMDSRVRELWNVNR